MSISLSIKLSYKQNEKSDKPEQNLFFNKFNFLAQKKEEALCRDSPYV